MAEPDSGQLAAELAWAVNGAALEIESLKVRLAILQGVAEERNDVIAELQSHVSVMSRAADERAVMIGTLDEVLAHERQQHADIRERLTADRDRAIEAATVAQQARNEDFERALALQRQMEEGLEAFQARVAALEQEMVERQGTINDLVQTCEQRLTVINELSAALKEHEVRSEALRLAGEDSKVQ